MSRSRPPARSEPARIIDITETARLLGRDYFTVRLWALSGVLPLVEFPSPEIHKKRKGRRPPKVRRPLRRLLFDRLDVERFIEKCKKVQTPDGKP